MGKKRSAEGEDRSPVIIDLEEKVFIGKIIDLIYESNYSYF